MKKALVLAEKDNVAVVLDDVISGEKVEIAGLGTQDILHSRDTLNLAHKIALLDIPKGEAVLKYGEVIGIAVNDIPRGSHVHIHNIQSTRIGGH
ncbi:MAG: UxaA family hydrolase [Peptococcaceae bacterium]